jgi:hypothetical protein
MTTSRIGSRRGGKALLVALALVGGLAAGATVAEAAPAFGSPAIASREAVTPIQYWGEHGGGGYGRHWHHGDHGGRHHDG